MTPVSPRHALPGAWLTHAPQDWQIVQRDLPAAGPDAGRASFPDPPVGAETDGRGGDGRGVGVFELAGGWRLPAEYGAVRATVEARIVFEETNQPPTAALDWHPVDATEAGPEGNVGTWRHALRGVPAGGLYRIETRLQPRRDEWRLTGDRVHHLGVGDLWLIAGQSNAVGYGHGPIEDPLTPGVHLFRGSEQWALADHPLNDPTRTRHPDNFDSGWNDHAPWIAFGRQLWRATAVPVGLIPTALGGSAIARWDPRAAGEDGAERSPEGVRAVLWENLLALWEAACAWRVLDTPPAADGGPVLRSATPSRRAGGLIWHQGCSETGDLERVARYPEVFARLVAAIRVQAADPELPVLTYQINAKRTRDNAAGWTAMRDTQRRIAETARRVAVIPTLGLPRSDQIHNAPQAHAVIAERSLRAALALRHGRAVRYRAPSPSTIRFEKNDRAYIRLDFDHVAGELWQHDDPITQFTVADDAGPIRVKKAVIVKPAAVRLTLERPAGAEARVHNGEGCHPPVCLLDRDNRPILAFANLAVGEESVPDGTGEDGAGRDGDRGPSDAPGARGEAGREGGADDA